MTKYLARLGHRVTVLTSVMSGSGPVPGAAATIRARDLLVSRLNWRRASFAALKGESLAAYAGTPSALSAWVIPDLEIVGWIPFALPRALALARREHFDCVITSSPPQSAHLIGLALQRRGTPWVADLRDGWSFEPGGERFPPGRRRAADRMLEEAVLARADAAVGVTPPIGDDLRARVNPRGVTITNGFDPDEMAVAAEAAAEAPVDPARFTIAYTGTLAYGGTSAQPLMDAVRMIREGDPVAASRLEVVFAGPMSSTDLAELQAPDLHGSVRVLGAVSRTESLGLQRAADALLLFVDGRRPSIATGKLYEYLFSGRPILVLGEGSVAARIVSEVGAGLVVRADDAESISAGLQSLMAPGDDAQGASPETIDRFSYASIAREMSELVEGAIAHRARG